MPTLEDLSGIPDKTAADPAPDASTTTPDASTTTPAVTTPAQTSDVKGLSSTTAQTSADNSMSTGLPAADTSSPGPTDYDPNAPPTINIPKLDMPDDASVTYQLNKIQSTDSLSMQQARENAFEKGADSGAIHGSQQEGAAERATADAAMPLATSEANLAGNTALQGWTAAVKAETDRYDNEYKGYISKLGFASNEKIAMIAAQTSLTNTLMNNVGSLLGNSNIDFGPEVKNKLTDIFNNGMQNNSNILDMGFTY